MSPTLDLLLKSTGCIAYAVDVLLKADLIVFFNVGQQGAIYWQVQSAAIRLPALRVVHTFLAIN